MEKIVGLASLENTIIMSKSAKVLIEISAMEKSRKSGINELAALLKNYGPECTLPELQKKLKKLVEYLDYETLNNRRCRIYWLKFGWKTGKK